jgi:hypothetical protein
MKRVAGCLVLASLVAMAVWACGDEQDERDDRAAEAAERASMAVGSGSGTGSDARVDDIGMAIDDVMMGSDLTGEPGGGSDADAPPCTGSGCDAMPCTGSGCDAQPDGSGAPGDGDGTGEGTDDAAGRGDARRGREIDPADRTSFYACAGGGASTGMEIGVPIGLALLFAVHRRRRWRRG